MRFSYVHILASFGATLAAPALMMPRQDDPSVTFCDGIDFAAPCAVAGIPLNTCVSVPADYDDKISSFKPSSGVVCLLWSDGNCQGSNPGGFLGSEGSNDLRVYDFNDVTSSFECKTA